MHQLFYVTLEPEKAMGIEDLIPSYHILYSDPSQLALPITYHGIDIKQFPKDPQAKVFGTSKLLENKNLQTYIKNLSHGSANIMVFKNDSNIVEVCKQLGYNLLNPEPVLAKQLENKVGFAEFLEHNTIFKSPEYRIFNKLSDVDYDEIEKEFGYEFIVQFMYGHSGNSTFFIANQSALNDLQNQYPDRKCKVSKKVEGIPYTINACITKLGVVIGGISEQITGIETLTSSKGGTVGNDFTQRHLNEVLRTELIEKTMAFGELLEKEGHRGIFGLDVILNQDEMTFYLIEANIRQVRSCPFVSYLQREQKQVPIMLWHVLELINHDFDTPFVCLSPDDEEWINDEINAFKLSNNKLDYNVKRNQPIKASQVFFRNIEKKAVKMVDPFPAGIYRIRGRLPEQAAMLEGDSEEYPAVYHMREDGWSTLCLIDRGYNIIQANEQKGFIIYCMPEDSLIGELEEIGRLQFMDSAFSSNDSFELSGWVHDVIDTIYENIRLIPS